MRMGSRSLGFLTGLMVLSASVLAQQEGEPAAPKLPSSAKAAVQRFDQEIEVARRSYDQSIAKIASGYLRKVAKLRAQHEARGEAEAVAILDHQRRIALIDMAEANLRLGQSADLLSLMEVKADDATWSATDKGWVVKNVGNAVLAFPFSAQANYEARFQLQWVESASVRLILPVGPDAAVGCDLYWADEAGQMPMTGLTLQGQPSASNPLTRPSTIKSGYRHAVDVQVKMLPKQRVQIGVRVDGSNRIAWTGGLNELAILESDAQHFGERSLGIVAVVPEEEGLNVFSTEVSAHAPYALGAFAPEAGASEEKAGQSSAMAYTILQEQAARAQSDAARRALGRCEATIEGTLRYNRTNARLNRETVVSPEDMALNQALAEIRAQAQALILPDME